MQPLNDQQYQHTGNLELLARQVVEGFITGLHKSPFHGFSVEFAEHRAYNTGDSVKNVDWKLFARTEKLYSKRYEEETNLRCQFVLDISSSMYFPDRTYNKVIFSIQAIASLIYLLKRQRDAFGLSLFSDHILLNTAAKSTGMHQKYLFSKLEQLLEADRLNVPTNLAQNLHQIADLVHKRSLIVIFSDMLQPGNLKTDGENAASETQMDAVFSALQHLKFNKHEVVIFNVHDREKEIDFKFENRPYEFVDMETGAVLKANSAHLREQYQDAMQAHRQKVALKCAQYHIDLVDADIHAGFSGVLQAYLIKRQKMS